MVAAAVARCEPSKIGVATRRLTNRPETIDVDQKRRMTRRMTRREEILGNKVDVREPASYLASPPASLVLQPMHDLIAGGIAGSVSVVVGRE